MTLSDIVQRLYRGQPTKTLFHYTSLSGMEGIVRDRFLRAGEIRYLNDESELLHFTHWLDGAAVKRQPPESTKVLSQFQAWYTQRLIGEGPMVFVGCFTENGNLLSQ